MTSQQQTLSKFVVQSSDVISDMRVNVLEEGSETVLWYKERFLSDEEIIEHVFDNANSTICWTIHKPKRGWYIRIRSPSFPPGVFIPLMPIPKMSPYYTDAGITFTCRIVPHLTESTASTVHRPSPPGSTKSSLESDMTLTDAISSTSSAGNIVHSYPPTPPAQMSCVVVQPPSPKSVHAKLSQLAPLRQPTRTQTTQFLLAPHSTTHVPRQPEDSNSLFSRMFSVLKNHAPSRSHSFTLSPIGPSPSPTLIPHEHFRVPSGPIPLLIFHDRTPPFTVRTTSGLLEINDAKQRAMGIAPSFWIAVALTYLEFLEDRASYLAAATD